MNCNTLTTRLRPNLMQRDISTMPSNFLPSVQSLSSALLITSICASLSADHVKRRKESQ